MDLESLKAKENPAQPSDALEARIVAELERKPPVAAPADFAARVAGLAAQAAPVERSVVASAISWSRVLTAAGVLALAAAIFFLAPGTPIRVTSLRFYLELALLLQLAAGGWWLTVRGR